MGEWRGKTHGRISSGSGNKLGEVCKVDRWSWIGPSLGGLEVTGGLEGERDGPSSPSSSTVRLEVDLGIPSWGQTGLDWGWQPLSTGGFSGSPYHDITLQI